MSLTAEVAASRKFCPVIPIEGTFRGSISDFSCPLETPLVAGLLDAIEGFVNSDCTLCLWKRGHHSRSPIVQWSVMLTNKRGNENNNDEAVGWPKVVQFSCLNGLIERTKVMY